MKKKLLAMLLAVVLAVGLLPGTAFAADASGKCGDNLTWSLSGGVLTISGTGAMTEYSYGAVPWYGSRNQITTVVIGDGVTTISNGAFSGCESLTGVTIPGSVKSIGDAAFSLCRSLTGVTIPEGVTTIGGSAFSYCGLTSVTIPGSVTTIGGVRGYAFSHCASLTSVTIREGVSEIGGQAFWQCANLTSVTIPSSVKSIREQAFGYCGLTSASIPEGVTKIWMYAFQNCGNLTSVSLPKSVTEIGEDAFRGCGSLTDVYYAGSKFDWREISIGSSNDQLTGANIRYGDAGSEYGTEIASGTCGENLKWVLDTDFVLTVSGTGAMADYDYSNPAPWSSVSNQIETVVIGNGVTTIGFEAFSRCSRITGATIPNSVTSISSYAFFHCTSLKGVTIPNSVTSIGSNVFAGCTSLTSMTIPKSMTEIPYAMFYDCTGLTSVTIPDSVTTIGGYAFRGCRSLTGVTIPNSVTRIGPYAFRYCTGLTGITIPDSVTSIGYSAFQDCTGLTSLTIPDSVTGIGDSAFERCFNLTSVTIPDSVTSIVAFTFQYCGRLTSVTIPDSVTSIGYAAFRGCTGLTSVTIPAGVTSIDHGAFDGCGSLTDVYFGGSEAQWKEIATYSLDDAGYRDKDFTFGSGGQKYAGLEGVTVHFNSAAPETPTVSGFTDVKSTDYFADAVVWAVEKGVTKGTSATKFTPGGSCTRAEIVTFLWRACDKPEPKTTVNPFTDVKPSAYYYKAVLWAVENGIVNGTTATTFGPKGTCTRRDAITFLWRSAGKPAATGNIPFTDVPSGKYYSTAVAWAAENGIAQGTGAFNPKNICTRADIVTFLYRELV